MLSMHRELEMAGAVLPQKRRRAVPEVRPPEELGITYSSSAGKLLRWLLRYPFLRIEDWALVLAVDRTTASRQFERLGELGLVECAHASLWADMSNLYYLNAAGLVTVARLERSDPARLARAWAADERGLLRLLPRLPALLYLQGVINGLIARAPLALAANDPHMEVNWQWRRDYGHSFSYHHRRHRCSADAIVTFHLHPMAQRWATDQEKWYSAFMLVDMGLTGHHDEDLMAKRLEEFLCYRECAERTAYHRYFPPLLVLVQTPRQRDFWLKAVDDAATRLRLHRLAGAVACVPGEMDIPSSWPLPWRSLAGGAPCRLESLLVPMPAAALPAEAHASPTGKQSTAQAKAVPFVGKYGERARALNMQPYQGAGAEREIVALLGLRLERHHLDILQTLYRWPLLKKGELAALFDLRESTIERYLYELRRSFCLCDHDTDFGTRLYLSSRGLRLVAHVLGVSIQHIAAPVEKEDFPHRGQRVRLVHELDNFPQFLAPQGATGIIVSTSAGIAVRMDGQLAGAQRQVNTITWRVKVRRDASVLERESLVKAFSRDCELVLPEEARKKGEGQEEQEKKVEGGDEDYGELVQLPIRVLLKWLVDNPAAVRHTAGVYSFFTRLLLASRQQEGHEVRWWEVGSRCERRYRDHDSWHNLRPDATLEYQAGERRLQAWLEWDQGTMHRAKLETKLKSYATYVRTREWSREGLRTLPVLLIVAPHRKQETTVADLARQCLTGSGFTVCTTTDTRLTGQGVLAPVWAQAVPVLPDPVARRPLAEVTSVAR